MAKNTFQKHIDAVKSGKVDASNVRGIRMALNAFEREVRGYSTSSTAPRITEEQRELMLDDLLPNCRPLVTGKLHDTGIALLQSKRYRKQLESVAEIVADLKEFRLVGFYFIGRLGEKTVPVYRAYASNGKSFPFCNIPWQSGGSGPEIMSGNYY